MTIKELTAKIHALNERLKAKTEDLERRAGRKPRGQR